MAGLLGMFEVQLVSAGPAALVAFYRDSIGLEVSLEDPARGRTHFRVGGGQLIVAAAGAEESGSPAWPGLPPPLLEPGDIRGPSPEEHGPVHFAVEAPPDGLVGAGERFRAAGLDVRGPFRWPGGRRSIYVRDPDGNVAELITPPVWDPAPGAG